METREQWLSNYGYRTLYSLEKPIEWKQQMRWAHEYECTVLSTR